MPKKATKTTAAKTNGMVAKVKDFGKNIKERAKATGTAAKAAGAKAASHVSRNKAAYIAGGLGAAAAGAAIMSRKKQAQNDG